MIDIREKASNKNKDIGDHSDIAYITCGFKVGTHTSDGSEIVNNINSNDEYYLVDLENRSRLKVVLWDGLGSTVDLVRKVATRKESYRFKFNEAKVFELYEEGDSVAVEEVDNYFFNLALGIYNIQNVYEPKMILIDGEISKRDSFIDEINRKMDFIIKMCNSNLDRPILKLYSNKRKINKVFQLYSNLQI